MNDSIYIGIGSNIEPEGSIRAALRGIAELGRLTGLARCYRNPAIGSAHQPDYVNGVAEVSTDLSAPSLRRALRAIEASLGRRRSSDRFAARTIDLDILLYGDRVIPEMNIPDPNIWLRAFVALPLFELNEGLTIPVEDKLIRDVADVLPSDDLQPLDDFTQSLRKEFLA